MLKIVFFNAIIVIVSIAVFMYTGKKLADGGLNKEPLNSVISLIITLFVTEIISAPLFHFG